MIMERNTVEVPVDFDNLKLQDTENFSTRNSYSYYALGDMHGNAFKIVYYLFILNIIKQNDISLKVLKDLLEAYRNYNLKSFEKNITLLKFEYENIIKTRLIFIGDTLADRGQSDYMTLAVYRIMVKNNINFDITLSNQDCAFIEIFAKSGASLEPTNSFDYSRLLPSYKRLFCTRYIKYYLPYLKPIMCVGIGNKLYVYTHAPMNLNLYKLRISGINKIVPLVKKINSTFEEELKTSIPVSDLYSEAQILNLICKKILAHLNESGLYIPGESDNSFTFIRC